MSFRSSGDGGGRGMSRGNCSAPSGNFQTSGGNRGNFHARGEFKNFQARGEFKRGDGDFRARGQAQTRELKSRDTQSGEVKRDSIRSDFKGDGGRKDFKGDGDRKADYSRWKGNRPHLAHRGWDRHHKHRFFGVFLIGVPYGYYAVADNPCYDWLYGPQGWGYYWSYDRCPV